MAEETSAAHPSPFDAASTPATPAQGPATARAAGPWALPAAQGRFLALALGTAAVALLLRLVALGPLQNEIYGDINIVLVYVHEVLAGEWPFYFNLSAGPLYHYAIAPLIALTGQNYYGLKLASAAVSMGTLLATYALARRLIDDYFALLATFIAGVSSWLLIFSRLGNSQIMVPLLSTSALWLGLRAAQDGRRRDVVACAIVSVLGLYVYPQSFILPGVLFLTLLGLRRSSQAARGANLLIFVGVTLVGALPFVWLVLRDPANFVSGYIGGKLAGENALQRLAGNSLNALLAFNLRGDENFRSNPAQLPHLDPLSGLLFLAGVVFWLLPTRRRWSPALLLPLLLLQLPSVLVLSLPHEVPSASRTLGVAPLAYILAASGLWWLLQAIGGLRRARRLVPAVAGLALGAILLLNAQRYFVSYIDGLPYQNTHIGSAIVSYMDLLPPETQIYLVGCCWEGGMPEPEGMVSVMRRPKSFRRFEPDRLSCDQLRFLNQPAVFVWSSREKLPAPQLADCAAWLPAQLYSSPRGLPMFYAAPLLVGQPAPPGQAAAPAPADAQLTFTQAELGAEPIGVRHSPIDIGSIPDLFDGDRNSLIRGADANPLVIELRFTAPRPLSAVALDLGTMRTFKVALSITAADGAPRELTRSYQNLPSDPHVELELGDDAGPAQVLRVTITDLDAPPADGWHIHVRELALR